MMRIANPLLWFAAPASILPFVPIRADVADLRFELQERRLPEPLSDHTATKVGDKEVIYIVGGCNSTHGNVWNADSNQFECGSLSDSIYEIDANNLHYKLMGRLSSPRDRHATVNVNDQYLWILGGRDASFGLVDTVDAYEISTGEVFTFPLPEEYKTSDHAGFGKNNRNGGGGYAYFAGGYEHDYTIKSKVFRIDSAASIQNAKENNSELVIEDMQNMLEPRADFKGTLMSEEIAIVVGGFGTPGFCQPLASTEQYSIEEDAWRELPPLRLGTSDNNIVNFKDHLISYGGEVNDPENVDCNPGGKTLVSKDGEYLQRDLSEWKKMLDMPQPHFRFAAVPYDDKFQVMAFGGQLAYDASCNCYPATDAIFLAELGPLGSVRRSKSWVESRET